jgi:membrane-bound lytic murein transglycosylase B
MNARAGCLAVVGLIAVVIGGPGFLLFLLAASVSPVWESVRPPATAASAPAAVVAADEQASAAIGTIVPGCVVPAWVLLAVGQVESGNAAGHAISSSGEVSPPIIGPALDGSIPGTAAIPASDGGALTGDPVWDHAVGPMQILASTWRRWAVSAAGVVAAPKPVPDPQNIADAALTAAVILCQPPRDLADPAQLSAALYAYNHSAAYVAQVMSWAGSFAASPAGPPAASMHRPTQAASSGRKPGSMPWPIGDSR